MYTETPGETLKSLDFVMHAARLSTSQNVLLIFTVNNVHFTVNIALSKTLESILKTIEVIETQHEVDNLFREITETQLSKTSVIIDTGKEISSGSINLNKEEQRALARIVFLLCIYGGEYLQKLEAEPSEENPPLQIPVQIHISPRTLEVLSHDKFQQAFR